MQARAYRYAVADMWPLIDRRSWCARGPGTGVIWTRASASTGPCRGSERRAPSRSPSDQASEPSLSRSSQLSSSPGPSHDQRGGRGWALPRTRFRAIVTRDCSSRRWLAGWSYINPQQLSAQFVRTHGVDRALSQPQERVGVLHDGGLE